MFSLGLVGFLFAYFLCIYHWNVSKLSFSCMKSPLYMVFHMKCPVSFAFLSKFILEFSDYSGLDELIHSINVHMYINRMDLSSLVRDSFASHVASSLSLSEVWERTGAVHIFCRLWLEVPRTVLYLCSSSPVMVFQSPFIYCCFWLPTFAIILFQPQKSLLIFSSLLGLYLSLFLLRPILCAHVLFIFSCLHIVD